MIGLSGGFNREGMVLMRKSGKKLILLFSVVFLVGCDHATKQLAQTHLEQQSISVVSGLLDLKYTENPGMAFGILRGVPEKFFSPLLIIGRGVLIILLFVLWWRLHPAGPWIHVTLAALMAGAIGNWVDLLSQGFCDRLYLLAQLADFQPCGCLHHRRSRDVIAAPVQGATPGVSHLVNVLGLRPVPLSRCLQRTPPGDKILTPGGHAVRSPHGPDQRSSTECRSDPARGVICGAADHDRRVLAASRPCAATEHATGAGPGGTRSPQSRDGAVERAARAGGAPGAAPGCGEGSPGAFEHAAGVDFWSAWSSGTSGRTRATRRAWPHGSDGPTRGSGAPRPTGPTRTCRRPGAARTSGNSGTIRISWACWTGGTSRRIS